MPKSNHSIRKKLSEYPKHKNSWCLNCDYSGPHGVKGEIYPWFLTWRIPLLVYLLPLFFILLSNPWEKIYRYLDSFGSAVVVVGLSMWALTAWGAVVIIRWIVAWKSYDLVCPSCEDESITRNKPFNYLD